MRVLICGSRTWNDIGLVAQVMERMTGDVTIIHGDAAGADTIAHAVAEVLGFKIVRFPVTKEDWEKYGKGAGHRRNRQMLFEGEPDLIVAFLDTLVESPGTHGMMELGETYGKRVVVIKKDCWPSKCSTCSSEYKPDEISVCSNSFHCCRSCTWENGKVTVPCEGHKNGSQEEDVNE